MVMADKHPWCLLIPTDLIHYISQSVRGEFDVSKLRESAAEYIRIATRHGDDMQKVRALILTKQGRALKKLNKGDFVIYIYMFPPLMRRLKLEKEKRSIYSNSEDY